MIKKSILLAALVLSGCAMNMSRKQENLEAPQPIQEVFVKFQQRTTYPYTVQKRGSGYVPVINDSDKKMAASHMADALKAWPDGIQAALSAELAEKGIRSGAAHTLSIEITNAVIGIQQGNAWGFGSEIKPMMAGITYQASLYRNGAQPVLLWRGSFELAHIGKGETNASDASTEIAAKVTRELSSAGWLR